MLGGDKAFAEFRHTNGLNKAVWIEENGRKIFDPEIFKIRRGEKIVFYINAPMGNGIINLNFYGAYEDCFYITFAFTETSSEVIDWGRGFYLPAAVEAIATYPEEAK